MIENELNIFMLKNLSPFLAVILLLSNGCAGRQPQPVLIVQKGDEIKSCKEIDSELKAIRSELRRANHDRFIGTLRARRS